MTTVEVKFKDLREAVIALNESGLAPKIKLIGADKETILKNFMEAMNAIEDVDGKFPGPKAALTFYNAIVDAEEKAAKEAAKPAKKPAAKEAAKPVKEKPVKEKPVFAKEPKLGKNTVTKKSIVIAGVRKAGGATIEMMAEECTNAGLGDLETNKKTVALWLRKLGFKVEKNEKGFWMEKK